MVEEKGKQAEERQDEPRLWRPWRPPRRRMRWRVLWGVGMLAAVLTTALMTVALRPEIWKDLLEGRVLRLVALGFSLTAIVVMLAIAGTGRSWTGFQGKTVWDFLQLLIVPLMLVAIGFWFTAQQDARQQKIEKKRAEADRELAEKRAQDEALQAYLNQMSTLLLEKNLRNSGSSQEDTEVRTLARARTLTVLERLDPSRKRALIQFLEEADLVQGLEEGVPLISSMPDLYTIGSFGRRQPSITLRGANLRDAPLANTDLQGVHLSEANLSGADLSGADLSDAHLRNANLRNADLSFAEGWTEKQLRAAKSLKGATMPNGHKYEDWIKSRGEGGQTTAPEE